MGNNIWKSVFDTGLVIGKITLDYLYTKEEERKIILSDIKKVDNMTGKEFEFFLSACYKKLGYSVTPTPVTQDYGADLILIKDGIKTVVQAKRSKNPVSVKAVQEIVAAIKYYKASQALVVTNNKFTKNARNLARFNKVSLLERGELMDFIIKIQSQAIH